MTSATGRVCLTVDSTESWRSATTRSVSVRLFWFMSAKTGSGQHENQQRDQCDQRPGPGAALLLVTFGGFVVLRLASQGSCAVVVELCCTVAAGGGHHSSRVICCDTSHNRRNSDSGVEVTACLPVQRGLPWRQTKAGRTASFAIIDMTRFCTGTGTVAGRGGAVR